MVPKKRALNLIGGYLGICFFVITALASASAQKAHDSWQGSYGQQAVQHLQQNSQGGTYVGIASSEAEAAQLAIKAGFKYYQYYPSTGACYGYR